MRLEHSNRWLVSLQPERFRAFRADYAECSENSRLEFTAEEFGETAKVSATEAKTFRAENPSKPTESWETKKSFECSPTARASVEVFNLKLNQILKYLFVMSSDFH